MTRDYLNYVRNATRKAVADFVPFDEADKTTDWSAYQDMPAFSASNRGDAFRIYLEMDGGVVEIDLHSGAEAGIVQEA
jgi:hypothetical protein